MANDKDTDTGAAEEAPRQTPPSAKDATPGQRPSKLRRLVLPLAVAGATGAAVFARRRSNGENGDRLVARVKQVASGALEKVQEIARVKDAGTAAASKVGKAVKTGEGSGERDGAADAGSGGREAGAGDAPSRKRRELPARDPRELEAARRERQARREERRKRAEA